MMSLPPETAGSSFIARHSRSPLQEMLDELIPDDLSAFGQNQSQLFLPSSSSSSPSSEAIELSPARSPFPPPPLPDLPSLSSLEGPSQAEAWSKQRRERAALRTSVARRGSSSSSSSSARTRKRTTSRQRRAESPRLLPPSASARQARPPKQYCWYTEYNGWEGETWKTAIPCDEKDLGLVRRLARRLESYKKNTKAQYAQFVAQDRAARKRNRTPYMGIASVGLNRYILDDRRTVSAKEVKRSLAQGRRGKNTYMEAVGVAPPLTEEQVSGLEAMNDEELQDVMHKHQWLGGADRRITNPAAFIVT